MESACVRVGLGARSYDVRIGSGLLAEAGETARRAGLGRRALVVADSGVPGRAEEVRRSLEAAGIEARIETIPAGEASKTVASAARLWDALAAFDRGVRPGVAAVGGGVVGDLAGFAAATWRRGVPILQCPTTLLAMVDSSVGGKTAVDHPAGKNLIGAFHQPCAVLADVAAVESLPEAEYRCGLAEAVKHGVLGDAELFAALERRAVEVRARAPAAVSLMVERSVRLKASFVERDERDETGHRALLNLGHTFAHGIEAAGNFAGRHGEAVALGLVAAARLAAALGRCDAEVPARIEALLRALGVETRWRGPVDAVLEAMRGDKKSIEGTARFVLPTGIGAAVLVDDAPPAAVRAALEGLAA